MAPGLVPGKPFQPSLMFVRKARSLPKLKHLSPGMGEIEKVGDLKSQYQKPFEKYQYWEISNWLGQNFSIQDEKVQD